MPKKRERKSHVWQKHPDNWYVEERWCVEALFREVSFEGTIHDPCCGMGTIPLVAIANKHRATGSDVADRWLGGYIGSIHDFKIKRYQDDTRTHDNIVCNPPFDDINKPPLPFLQWALDHVAYWGVVALLVPFKWFGGDKRSRILETMPLARVLILTPRPSMPPGDALLDMWACGEEPGGGREDFAWVIFDRHHTNADGDDMPPEIGWIHRDQDYK